MQKSIRVRILDREYPLRVRAEDESLTRTIAEYVDGKMSAVREAIPEQPDLTFAVIASLAIAEELFSKNEELSRLLAQVESEAKALDEKLAAVL